MADSIALAIMKAAETRLGVANVQIDGQTYTPPSNLTVERERVGVIQPKHVRDGPLVVIHRAGQSPSQRDHHKSPMLRRVLKLKISIAANAGDVKNSEALDPPGNWVVQALQSEPTLGGIAHWISEEGEEDYYTMFEDSSEIVVMREMDIHIAFHTRTENPETRS